jgi:hypothetical protein
VTAWLARRAETGDNEAAAALVILNSRWFSGDPRATRHIDDRAHGIRWDLMLEDPTWSSGERALLQVGQVLWTGEGGVNVAHLFSGGISDDALLVVIAALEAHRGNRPMPAHGRRDEAAVTR